MKTENAIKLLEKYGEVIDGKAPGMYHADVGGERVKFWAPYGMVRQVWVESPDQTVELRPYPTVARAIASALHREHTLIFDYGNGEVLGRVAVIIESYDPYRGLKRTLKVFVDGAEVNGTNAEWAALVQGAIDSGDCRGLLDYLEEHTVAKSDFLVLI